MLIKCFALVGTSQKRKFTQPYSVTTYMISARSVVTILPGARLKQIFETGPFLVFATDDMAMKDFPPFDNVAPRI